ncbi:class II fumarate hydratase [Halieaceae bacterium IMCC14734]|uniref:Fumarate hydratase class II n=1 Tax=Candidatus Litorirhabdus singularis TaxID=2518993 RepID=A0ABT3TCV3_9GAMM|nr:class II fumarate hydratase [Candidatus Litorirhabdus singularis]MCX2979274.1 class II fumarate hydratase [Candidatus Litorirhabdus singularis]
MTESRIEKDSLGEIAVPVDALYGAQTQRAVENFPFSGLSMPAAFIRSLGLIKAAAASANADSGVLEPGIAAAIIEASTAVATGVHDAQFPVDVFQTGSGTSTNMNANEVIAALASALLGTGVHPNDHVNCSQSSNDVIPTAIHVSAELALVESLMPALRALVAALAVREAELADIVKTGRTHLMDAMPVTLGQEISGWRAQLEAAAERIDDCRRPLRKLAQGGTAVGTGINADPGFAGAFCAHLSRLSGCQFGAADNYFAALASQDTVVALSGQLRTLAVALMKIANDLRWMNSGPLAGLGEISLQPLQPGSSIMPGKVNPVIPEAVAMAAAQVMGNDATIAIAGQSGNFQLNVMLPVIAYNLLQSIQLLSSSCSALTQRCVADFEVREENLAANLARNPVLVTALNREIGYTGAAEIAKRAYQEGRDILDVAQEMTDLGIDRLQELLDPGNLV